MSTIRLLAAFALLLAAVGCQQTATKGPQDASFQVPPLQAKHSPQGLAVWDDILMSRAQPLRLGFCIDTMLGEPPEAPTPQVRVGWSPDGLLVRVDAPDSSPYEVESLDRLYEGDSVELFLARADDPTQAYQVIIAPGVDPKYPQPRWQFFNHGAATPASQMRLQVTRTSGPRGYVLEALLPWSNLPMVPERGRAVLFQVLVNDASAAGQPKVQHLWYPAAGTHQNSRLAYRLVLDNQASPPVQAIAGAEVQRYRRVCVTVTGSLNLAGAPLRVQAGTKTLGTGVMEAREQKAVGRIILPLPARGQDYGVMDVWSKGRLLASTSLPPIQGSDAQAREDAAGQANFKMERYVFAGQKLPTGAFEDPLYIEDILGPYTVKLRYFDANYQEVTRAEKPGRYGVVIEVKTPDGKVRRRYQTLYRQPQEIADWDHVALNLRLDLPPELGIGATLAAEQQKLIGETLKWPVIDSAFENEVLATLLAALSEIKPGEPPMVQRTNAWSRADQWRLGLKRKLGDPLYPYLTQLPDKMAPGQKYPLLLFLHGSGERGTDLARLAHNGVFTYTKAHPELNFIVIAPQCPNHEWWSAAQLDAQLTEICAHYPVDPERIYLSGLSMGGFGSWNLAMYAPQRFAAVAPICGIGDKDDVARIKDLPFWVFHGAADTTVPIAPDAAAVAALQKISGRVRFTIYPGVGHDSWTATYADPRLYNWLCAQKRGQPTEPPGGTGGAATMPAKPGV